MSRRSEENSASPPADPPTTEEAADATNELVTLVVNNSALLGLTDQDVADVHLGGPPMRRQAVAIIRGLVARDVGNAEYMRQQDERIEALQNLIRNDPA